RLGWNHQGRLDLALHPDSVRGQTVMNFLRTHNIAFIAFRSSIPGHSTGAHIHVGLPSSRK
ncbi:MAG: hypothetical protein AB1489_42610, partial [Acidobacteriota bacterium]